MNRVRMNRRKALLIRVIAGCCAVLAFIELDQTPDAAPDSPSPERKAIDYLSREVPHWSKEHRCFSCHNNGDAARALYEAKRRGGPLKTAVPDRALADTTRWLNDPEGWDHNGGEGPFSDKVLAHVQFASALVAAKKAGAVRDRMVFKRAAERLAKDQADDGSWPVEGGDAIGSPAAYGPALATLSARDSLQALDPERYLANITKADRRLFKRPVENVLDAAVALMAGSGSNNPEAIALRGPALKILRAGQAADGGWGPFVNARPEPFDTALAVLALCELEPDDDLRDRIKRGRNHLIATQLKDGSWPETTRPPGAESYAQRLSTTGWATLALLRSSTR